MGTIGMLSDANLEELVKGYRETEGSYVCLFCGSRFEKGMIYKDGEILYESERYARIHIEKEHGSVFECLVELDKRDTGLTDHQNSLLRLFYQGKNDTEIQKLMNIGSASTIRNHRFALKEKERQAKVFIAMMELLRRKDKAAEYMEPHKTAKMVDDRYNVTVDENEKLLKNLFVRGPKGPIKTFAVREKHKLVILREISKRFDSSRKYTEKEVNEILKTAYEDFVTLRRYMIEYGFMDRETDGSRYWLKVEK